LNGHKERVGGVVVEEVVVVGVKGEGRSCGELKNPIFSRSNPEDNLFCCEGVDVVIGKITRCVFLFFSLKAVPFPTIFRVPFMFPGN
jgi:hypothetical protein